MIKKGSITTFISALILFVLINVPLFIYLGQRHYIDAEGVVLGNFRQPEAIIIPAHQDFNIKQEIVSTQDNLAKITLTTQFDKQTDLAVTLTNNNSDSVVRQGKIMVTETPGHVQYVIWKFDPISDSQRKNYTLDVRGTTDNGEIAIYTVTPERYDGGSFYLNGTEQQDVRAIIDWQYYTAHPLKTMLQRLTYMRPGIFNHQATFVLLISALEILSFIVLWLILNHLFITKH